MAVEWGDLVTPTGELRIAVLFPDDGDSGQARLTGYITDALAQIGTQITDNTAKDKATKLWAYYRAYLEKYQASLAEAASGGLDDQGEYATLWSQIKAWKELADERLLAFQAMLDAAIADTSDALGGWSVLRSLRHA